MKKTFAYSLALVASLLLAPLASANHGRDCKFLEKASEGSLFWSLLGSVAQTNTTNFALPPGGLSQTNATNAAVQGVGAWLATNHVAIYSNAAALQQTNGCQVSDSVPDKQIKALRKLAKLTGPKFDKAFLVFVIEETKEQLEDAQEAALEAKNPDVRAFARHQLVALTAQLVAALEAGESVFGGDFSDIDCD